MLLGLPENGNPVEMGPGQESRATAAREHRCSVILGSRPRATQYFRRFGRMKAKVDL